LLGFATLPAFPAGPAGPIINILAGIIRFRRRDSLGAAAVRDDPRRIDLGNQNRNIARS
jgi:hypothetical protein